MAVGVPLRTAEDWQVHGGARWKHGRYSAQRLAGAMSRQRGGSRPEA
jgi:hypothetical protein